MPTLINRKLGERSNGRRRVWLEGQQLAADGYEPGMKLRVEVKGDCFVLHAGTEGQYTVSSRNKNGRITPVIDCTAEELADLFDGVEKVRIAIQRGKIVVTAHHQQQRVNERVEAFMKKIDNGQPLDFASLYHGGGILDRALHDGYGRVGIKTRIAVAVEVEARYLECSRRNNSVLWDEKSVAIEGPIQDVDLYRRAPSVDALCAGIPCTGASKSGRSKNKLDYAESHSTAGALFFTTLEFIKILNPAVVWLENVSEYLNTASWEVIKSVLTSLNYKLHVTVLDGFELGALEKRRRMCCVAVSEGLPYDFDLESLEPIRKREESLAEILEDIPLDSPRWKTCTYLAEKEAKDKAAGKGFSRQLLTPEADGCGTIGRGYSKLRSTEPFLVHPEDPSLVRIFTPTEHARVKTIRPALVDGECDTIAHEILGQSVDSCAFEAAAFAHGTSIMAYHQQQPTAWVA